MTTPEQPSPGSPSGPQSPGAGPQSPGAGPQSPPASPQSPGGSPQSPGGGVAAPPAGGGMPPGGWQAPMPAAHTHHGALAGFGSRLIALIVDGIIIFVPAAIVMAVLGFGVFASGSADSDAGIVAFILGILGFTLVFVVVAALYAPLLMARGGQNNGQTIGRQLTGIRVVRTNGQPMSFGTAALREVVIKGLGGSILFSTGIGALVVLLDYLWPLWDDQNRALHDMAASTLVVKA